MNRNNCRIAAVRNTNFIFFSLAIIVLAGCSSGPSQENSLFIWEDSKLEERADYLMFRNLFKADSSSNATIHVFADSRYHLLVNGTFVNFGPVRFYPEHPWYDSYDISEYLLAGDNVVAVKVLSNGMNTYQVPVSQAGFIAWGEVSSVDGKRHSFETPGNWLCKEMQGFDRHTPKMSFATGSVESYNTNLDPAEWTSADYDESEWTKPHVIANQNYWGALTERIIPPLTQDRKSAAKLLGAYSLMDDEDIYSFRVASPDRTRNEFGTNKFAFAYTYIFSPKKQKVKTGLWWGEHWLNGKGPLKNMGLEDGKPNRSDVILDLEEGWNYFFIKYGIVWASWNFYMAIPNAAEIELSPSKEIGSEDIFMTAGPFTDEEEEMVRNLELPFSSPENLPKLSAGWLGQHRSGTAGNPAWEIAWSYIDVPLDINNMKPKDSSREKSKDQTPNGNELFISHPDKVSLVYDIGGKTLGRIFADIECDSGTVIDIAFAEDLQGNRPWILKRAGIFTGLRFIASEGLNHFESFKPYGARYLQMNISNYKSPLTIHDFGMVSQIYPYKKTGSFECSDTLLNAIWELGWRTLRVCSEDSYTDTPFRERGLYAGDALPEYAISLATSGDSRLMQQSIGIFAGMYSDLMIPEADKVKSSVNHMADFPLITLLSYTWAVNRTSDLKFAERHYDGYKNMLTLLSAGRMDNGLLEHGRAFIEWTKIDKNANLTAIQSLSTQAYKSMAYVAGILDRSEDADWFNSEADITLEAMNRLCWDDEKGAFRDGFKDGKPMDNYYPISSIWPSLFGQTTAMQESRLSEFYEETLSDIGDKDRDRLSTPYGGFYVLGGLYRHGHASLAENFMKKYWGPMIAKHNDTAWENFGDGSSGDSQGTLSHAWSGGPTYQMSAHILGVDMGFPHFPSIDTLVLKPQAASLSWARGAVPHPDGIIEIEWKVEGDILYYNCKLPESVTWRVEPIGALAEKELWVNNEKSGK